MKEPGPASPAGSNGGCDKSSSHFVSADVRESLRDQAGSSRRLRVLNYPSIAGHDNNFDLKYVLKEREGKKRWTIFLLHLILIGK